MLRLYREYHAERIKLDRSGDSSITTSLRMRVAWASGTWLTQCDEVFRSLSDGASLIKWGVLQRDGASDQFLAETCECIARNFCGLMARSYSLWSGGVYTFVRVLSDNPSVMEAAVRRARALFPRVLSLDRLLGTEVCHPDIKAFGARFLWLGNVLYRELLGVLAMGSLDAAKVLSLEWGVNLHRGR